MNRFARLAAVVAPALGLAGLWGISDHTYRQGTEWDVPIEGYDPRDFLRGHYVVFRYDWPLDEQLDDAGRQSICLEGEAPNIRQARPLADGDVCDHPIREDADRRLSDGRLYIGQARAAQLEEELRNRDQRGIVTIRQRDDGSFTPIAIRFRPLTPEERAARDRNRQTDPLDPPAIMTE